MNRTDLDGIPASQTFGAEAIDRQDARPLTGSMLRGAGNTCPACGTGPLFAGFLKVADECAHCGEELHHHRADDLPAYLNVFVTGHVVVGLMMGVMMLGLMSMWTMTFLTAGLALVAAFALMRPLKGMVVGAQWALRMHGFGGDER